MEAPLLEQTIQVDTHLTNTKLGATLLLAIDPSASHLLFSPGASTCHDMHPLLRSISLSQLSLEVGGFGLDAGMGSGGSLGGEVDVLLNSS